MKTLKNKGIAITKANLRSKHRDTVESKISQSELLDKLKTLGKFRRQKFSCDAHSIVIKTSELDYSAGEVINIKFKEEAGVRKIEISSKPRLFFNLLDGGANYENVKLIKPLI